MSSEKSSLVDSFVMWSFKDDECLSSASAAALEEVAMQNAVADDETTRRVCDDGDNTKTDLEEQQRTVRFNKFEPETDCPMGVDDDDDDDDYTGQDHETASNPQAAHAATEHYHPLLLSTRRDEYLDARTFRSLIDEHPALPVILVDLQFVGSEVVEIAVASPQMPVVFHDVYPMCMIDDIKRPLAALTGVVSSGDHKKQNNRNTINANMSYLKMACCYGHNRHHNVPMRNNKAFFQCLPPFAVYVLRGHNKHSYWEELLKTYGKHGKITIFAETFYRPGYRKSHTNCLAHEHANAACSLANVRKMSKYYNHCTYMFN